MSTTPVESWAVDPTTLGPVYPFVGSEMIMVIILLVIWAGWHVCQISSENRLFSEEARALKDPQRLQEAMRLTNGT
jgi:hypothetical protein